MEASEFRKQIPQAGFPSGIAVPSAIALVLLLVLAGGGWLLVGDDRSDEVVATAVVDSQMGLTRDLADGLTEQAQDAVRKLRAAVDVAQNANVVQPSRLVEDLARGDQWHGVAMFGRERGKLRASHGTPVPLPPSVVTSLDSPAIIPADIGGAAMDLVVAMPLDRREGSPLLGAITRIDLPQDAMFGGQVRTMLLVSEGDILATSGVPPSPSVADQAASRVKTAAMRRPADSLVTRLDEGAHSKDAAAAANPANEQARVTTYAALGDTKTAAIHVVLIDEVDAQQAQQDSNATAVFAVLAGVAVVGFVVLRLCIVRPVRRLRADSLVVAVGGLGNPVRHSRIREVAKLSGVLHRVQLGLGGGERVRGMTAPRLQVSATTALIGFVVVALAWASYVPAAFDRDPGIPERLVTDTENEVQRLSVSVADVLDRGITDLREIAESSDADEVAGQLDRLSSQSRYRSVSALGDDGEVVAVSGKRPRFDADDVPEGDGVRQANTSGRVPIVYAHTALESSGHVLVAEFDVPYLLHLVRQRHGHVRLVDAGQRVIADSGGFIAFEKVTDNDVESVLAKVDGKQSAADVYGTGIDAKIVAGAPVVGGGAAAELGWAAVAQKPVAELALPAVEQRRAALMVALVVALVAIIIGGWHFFVFVRPLRELGASAETMLRSPQNTVLYPQRHDEIGAIAICLEVCRRALVDGPDRLGTLRQLGPADLRTRQLRPVQPVRPRPTAAQRQRAAHPGHPQPAGQQPRAFAPRSGMSRTAPRRQDRRVPPRSAGSRGRG